MAEKENEAQILNSILPNEPSLKLDLSKLPDLATSKQIRLAIQSLKTGLALPVLPPERAASFVAVSRPGDIEYYAAYTRVLHRRPELAARTVSPSFFERLEVTGARMSAIDLVATQLGEKLLQCTSDLTQAITERNQLLTELLSRPDEEIVVGDIKVKHARLIFCEFLRECEGHERKADAKKDKVERARTRATGAADQAERRLDDQQQAERLRLRAQRGELPVPPPKSSRTRTKTRSKQP